LLYVSTLFAMTKAKIRAFIFNNFLIGGSEENLNDDDSLLEKGIIDSTGILELITFVEETFNIEVADSEVIPDNFDSVNKICSYIGRRTSS